MDEYQGSAIAQELTGTGTPTLVRTYVTDEAGTIVKICDPDCTGTNPAYLVTHNGHGDALALWRITSDGSLTLANSYTYSTWGAPTTATHNAHPDLGYRYLYVGAAGVAWDNALGLGLLHMGARHYSPSLGRFLQPDPSASETNLYGANSPVSRVDPSGLFAPAAALCLSPFTIKICIDAGVVLVTATGAVFALIVHGDTARPTRKYIGVVPRAVTHPLGRDSWWLRSSDRKLTDREVKWVERQLGEDVHDIKGPRGASKRDLWVRPDGEVVIKPKGGRGPGEPIGVNLRRMRGGGR